LSLFLLRLGQNLISRPSFCLFRQSEWFFFVRTRAGGQFEMTFFLSSSLAGGFTPLALAASSAARGEDILFRPSFRPSDILTPEASVEAWPLKMPRFSDPFRRRFVAKENSLSGWHHK